MTSAIFLQEWLFKSLNEQTEISALIGKNKIFDHVPPQTSFPYITLGHSRIYDWSTSTEIGEEHFLTIHIWAKGNGRKQVLEIIGAISDTLEIEALPTTGFTLINLTSMGIEARYEDSRNTYHGVMRYRAVTEPVN